MERAAFLPVQYVEMIYSGSICCRDFAVSSIIGSNTPLNFGHACKDILCCVLGRHAARALECKFVADQMANWILEVKPGEPVCTEFETPLDGYGVGLWEAPRGAVGHWLKIEDKKIANYQCVNPTNWNASPRDDKGQPDPIEQALVDNKIKDESNPFEVVRIARAFDP